MYLLFTDIFVNGLPVNYGISSKAEAFYFEPVFNPFDQIAAPSFSISNQNGHWVADGTGDHSIIDQAIETMEEYLRYNRGPADT